MNVLIIAQYFPPDMGGGATRAYNVAKGLLSNGCKVVVVSAFPHYPTGNIPREYRWKPLKIDRFEGFKVIRTIVPPLASKGLARRAILFLSFMVSSLFAIPLVGKVDVIWAANPNILAMFPAMVFGFLKKCPVTMNVDDLWPEDMYSLNLIKEGSISAKIAELLARIAYHKAKLITPISPGYVSVISGKYGVEINKIQVVMAGVDLRRFKPMKSKCSDNKVFKVLYSGAFSVAYDFEQVLKAAKLLESHGDIVFILQGGGELSDIIKRRVVKMHLKNVDVIDRILSREEVAKLLNQADILLLPLRDFGRPYLGISSKLYEYQAVGKPIICCSEGQPAEYIKETSSGIVVKPGDYKALADAILYLKENREVTNKMSVSGKLFVENNLSIEKVGERMITVISNFISSSSSFRNR